MILLTTPSRRGQRRIAIPLLLATLAVCAAPVSALDDDDDENEIEVIQFLESTGVDPDATAKVKWEREEEDGDEVEEEFKVKLKLLEPGSYKLFVSGVDRGDFEADDDDGEFEIEFESEDDDDGGDDDDLLLDFDVLEQVIEVRDGFGTVYFSDTFSPGMIIPEPGAPAEKVKIELSMSNVSGGTDIDADGEVEFEQEPGETEFKVKVKHLDDGAHELRLDGGVIAAFDSTGFEEVELKFEDPFDGGDDGDDDDDELELEQALDFDPLGKLIEVVRLADDRVILSVVMPESKGVAGVNPPKRIGKDLGRKKADKLELTMLNMGLIHGAEGKAVFELDDEDGERKLEVEVEDVPDATYTVCITPAGDDAPAFEEELAVALGEGEIEFSSDPEGDEIDLGNVVLRGARIDVKLDGDVVLSVVVSSSVPEATGKYKQEKRKSNKAGDATIELKLNLLNPGMASDDADDDSQRGDLDARGELKWKLKEQDGREKLDIKIEDLPDGAYELWVDLNDDAVDDVGEMVQAFTVVKGKAKLKFDSALVVEQPPKKLTLDFEVLGHTIRIKRAGDPVVILQTKAV